MAILFFIMFALCFILIGFNIGREMTNHKQEELDRKAEKDFINALMDDSYEQVSLPRPEKDVLTIPQIPSALKNKMEKAISGNLNEALSVYDTIKPVEYTNNVISLDERRARYNIQLHGDDNNGSDDDNYDGAS